MLIEQRGTAAWLCMQTGRANAINSAFLGRLAVLIDTFLEGDSSSLVLTGYQRYFSAGLDLPALIDIPDTQMLAFIDRFSGAMMRLFSIDRPVVAAINGHAIAGGCVLALQADYRIMAAGNFKIGLNEVPLGIGLPSVVLETLRCQVPASSLLPLALEGRLLSPDEALALGLVHEVVAPERLIEVAQAKAESLGALPRSGFSQVKRSLRRPIIETIQACMEEDASDWMVTWTSEAAHSRIQDTIQQLAAKQGTQPSPAGN